MTEYHVRSMRGRTVATFTGPHAETRARAFIMQQAERRVSLRLFKIDITETEL